MLGQRLMWIIWPAFLVACVLEFAVFGLIDPEHISWFGEPVVLSRQAVYAISFLIFWLTAAVSSAITTMLAQSPFDVNRCPFPLDQRPSDCEKSNCS